MKASRLNLDNANIWKVRAGENIISLNIALFVLPDYSQCSLGNTEYSEHI
jgi:hypothetical protein